MSATEVDRNQLESFYEEADGKHLIPLWKVTAKLLPPEPQTKVLPYLWKWSDLRRMAYRAGDLVPIIIREFAPPLSGRASKLFPLPFNLIPVHPFALL